MVESVGKLYIFSMSQILYVYNRLISVVIASLALFLLYSFVGITHVRLENNYE